MTVDQQLHTTDTGPLIQLPPLHYCCIFLNHKANFRVKHDENTRKLNNGIVDVLSIEKMTERKFIATFLYYLSVSEFEDSRKR